MASELGKHSNLLTLDVMPFPPTLIALANDISKLKGMLKRVQWGGLDSLSYGSTSLFALAPPLILR